MVDDSQTINNCRLGAILLFLSMKERKIFFGKDMESEMIMHTFDFCLKFCHLTLFSRGISFELSFSDLLVLLLFFFKLSFKVTSGR